MVKWTTFFTMLVLCVTSPYTYAADTLDTGPAQTAAPENPPGFEQVMHDFAGGGHGLKRKSIKKLVSLGAGPDGERIVKVLQLLSQRQLVRQKLKVDKNKGRMILLLDGAMGRDIVSGATVPLSEYQLQNVVIINSVFSRIKKALSQLQLTSPNDQIRLAASSKLFLEAEESVRELVETALSRETRADIKYNLQLALAKIDLKTDDDNKRIRALALIEAAKAVQLMGDVKNLLARSADGGFLVPNEAVRAKAQQTLDALESTAFWYNRVRDLIFGLSLGSILLLMALGLAITFGLMGVINMAHGEMLMLGAYVSYGAQLFFKAFMPELFDWYLVAAVPLAFVMTGAFGMALERGVIRFLYGRPLDTLLVTWGISLIIIQCVRLGIDSANVQVDNPGWLSGGIELLPGQIFPYNRLAVIVFALTIVSLVWYALNKTSLGLKVRAVQQNREMAASMGIATAKVDMWAFGLGTGIAGMGGVALSQIFNVGPNLGQSLIVESFMVVVTGGVGSVMGTVAGAYGIGMTDKFLETLVGPAMVQVCILVMIIIFIQWRPAGMFPPRGRLGET